MTVSTVWWLLHGGRATTFTLISLVIATMAARLVIVTPTVKRLFVSVTKFRANINVTSVEDKERAVPKDGSYPPIL